MKKIVILSATRPNHIKALPLYEELKKGYKVTVISTGQHYSLPLNEDITNDIKLPIHINLNTRSSDRWNIILQLEPEIKKLNPDLLIIIGDVNSSFSGAWVGKKLGIKIAHIESGMRSNDWRMEEEFNRYFIDSVSDYLFCNDQYSLDNLKLEFHHKKAYITGATNIDTLLKFKTKTCVKHKSIPYGVVTIHRRETIKNSEELKKIVKILNKIQKEIMPLKIFAHPHLKSRLNYEELTLNTLSPLSYTKFLNEVYNSNFVLTDSGSLQIESVFLNIPCITYRDSTEHLFTLKYNNYLTKNKKEIIKLIKSFNKKQGKINEKLHRLEWGDGNVSKRIRKVINAIL